MTWMTSMHRRSSSLSRRIATAATGVLAAVTVVVLAGCSPAPPAGADGGGDARVDGRVDGRGDASSPGVILPPAGGAPDYQLGGAYEPADGVGIVGRDRTAEPAAGRYSICYVNGFQTQPGERDSWDPDLLVTIEGEPLVDPEWPDEVLLDTSTADRRERILAVVSPWISGCADAGFDAVEFDNLDSFTRSHGVLDSDDNLALARAYVDVAHAAGLAAGQKNAAEYAVRLRDEAGFDFAVVEECAAYDECGDYTEVYGAAVVDIEYTDNLPRSWAEICADPATPASVVLRDRDLTQEGYPEHVATHC